MFIRTQEKTNKQASCCPNCNAPSTMLVNKGFYKRYFISYHDNAPVSNQVKIKCVKCTSCMRNHALLNSTIIPHSSFSVGFIISLLFSYITKKFSSIEKLCEHFDISINTFYKIYKSFLQDKKLLNSISDELRYLDELQLIKQLYSSKCKNLYCLLEDFFHQYNYSFLQRRCKFRLNFSP